MRARGTGGRRRGVAPILLLLLGLFAGATGAAAESWGGIAPGETVQRDVQALYGRPSREQTIVDEGRTAAEWIYAGDRAPRGLDRMVVSFGLMRGDRFDPEVVRSVTLVPHPHVWSLRAITNGWGKPDGIGTEEATGRPSLHYSSGLLVILDRTGSWAEFLLFAPRPAGAARP